MYMAKIGAKSAAFMNHKPFHPGNMQNLEKVWLAEQAEEKEKQKQVELQERRNQEVQIEELRRTLREKERQCFADVAVYEEPTNDADSAAKDFQGLSCLKSFFADQKKRGNRQRGTKRKRNAEGLDSEPAAKAAHKDSTHVFCWGSYREGDSWGYRCCKQTVKDVICTAA